MATVAELINKGACGSGEFVGYNIEKGCAPLIKDIVEIRITPSDFYYDSNTEYDADYLRTLQKDGKLNILRIIDLFESQSTDNQYATSSKGFESLAIEGIYKFRATFNNDVWFNKQLGFLEGERHKRVEFVDSRGTVFGTVDVNGNHRGFLVQHITRAMQTFLNGTNKQAQYLDIQFAEKSEFDDYPSVIDSGLLDRDTREIAPIVQANVSFNAVPSATDTTIALNVVYDRGMQGNITGLTTSGDFLVSINGVEEAPVAATELNGVYTITVTALVLDDVVEVSLNGVVEVLGDALYKSNKVSITTV